MNKRHVNVFLVEDDKEDQYLIELILKKNPRVTYELSYFDSVGDCLSRETDIKPDVILLDLTLPDSDGEATLHAVADKFRHVPVIVLTGIETEVMADTVIGAGAQDYLFKSELSKNQLIKSIAYAIDRNQLIRELEKRATLDMLTGLLNRSTFIDSLNHEIARAERYGGAFAIVSLDLDGFKEVNDTHGHMCGDELLKAFAIRLKNMTRRSDIAARFGGDEFCLLLTAVADEGEVLDIVKNKQQKLARTYTIEYNGSSMELNLGASIGVSIFPHHGETIDSLLIRADKALYRSKRLGKNQISIFNDEC